MINETSQNPRTTPRSMSNDLIRTVTGSTFTSWVLEAKGPIAVEFMSYGCVHCREMEPVLQQVAEMVKRKGTIFRVNTAHDQELTDSYEIQGTPTLVMFLNGKEVGRDEGPPPTVASVLTAVTHPFDQMLRPVRRRRRESDEMRPIPQMQERTNPVLLFNDECAVCRSIGHWVQKSTQGKSGKPSMVVRPIGDDPAELRSLNPELDIWDAYATIHVLMPDGSMKVGGEAVAEVLRNTKWFGWIFASIFGFRPFQLVLNVAYVILADVRPLFGCESCGTPSFWVRPIAPTIKWVKSIFGKSRAPSAAAHFSSLSARGAPLLPPSEEPTPQARQF